MKSKILKLSLICLVFALIGASCQDNEEFLPLEDKQLTVLEQQAHGCKENIKSTDVEQFVELKAEDKNKLRLKFINATLNCAGIDTTYAAINNETLMITFADLTVANCICEFDLECVVDSMEDRSYDIEIYAGGEAPEAKFTFNYSADLDEKFNVTNN